ncbi:MAG: ubiquinone/menaquinone biosynthesis methyltransferase [Caldilineaceae bacterium]
MKQSNSILPSSDEKPVYVNQMFTRIAPTYDLMNRLMTFGMDQSWRRQLLQLANLPLHGSLLDIGTGTGDIAQEARTRYPGLQAYGADFTYEMMAVGKASPARSTLPFMQADTFHLPFADDSFDAVVSGFLIRNVVDRVTAFREQARVTKPGGRVLCLETTPPSNAALGPLVSFYVFQILPLIGGLISGDPAAYRYLPQSTVEFPAPPQLQGMMEQAGLVNVFYQEQNFGTVAIHVGTKVAG